MNARSAASIAYLRARFYWSELRAMSGRALLRNEWRKSDESPQQKFGCKRFTAET
ncbi:hypothetical protein [Caballeronia sp. AZ1_KS37]|uniref:hypothetical protein n=1 Tax=Caballeronia sp. AZ1_KS37 TaxID=2921756 RepID=UPI002027E918|nr:hypothetical protein [Caballeronia sp. AZ1_KS37]